MTDADVRAALKERVRVSGGTILFARAHQLSQTYVQMVIRGDRTLGPKILAALGIKKTVQYEWIPR